MKRELPGDPDILVTLRRSARARRFSLRVSRLDGRVTLTMPARAGEAEAMAFARTQADWIRRAQAGTAATPVGFGMRLPVEGVPVELVAAAVRAPRIEAGRLLLPPDPVRAGARAQAWLRLLARERLQAATDRHALRLGRACSGLSLRDTRSRWGSCSPAGMIMYSWRLVMAPPEVLDYVAAHEVAHLAEMNHSPAFWAVVAGLVPGYARHRAWLRREGGNLHRFQFRPSDD